MNQTTQFPSTLEIGTAIGQKREAEHDDRPLKKDGKYCPNGYGKIYVPGHNQHWAALQKKRKLHKGQSVHQEAYYANK
ncbi:hypothetical protein VTP01DRAFT_7254 [Rhizomucor pusillus]|uniref:uncharacterized protein n=1 Tax=Rhizomucor pusillus TaxID=4840 RepID=UPI0037444360